MRLTYGAALLLIAIVVGLYWPALGYGWAYEDLNDPTRFLATPTLAGMFDRPNRIVTTWSFGLSWRISPVEPFGYHLISILIHALNTVLLFWLGRVIWAGVWLPFVCALVFAVHPLQTESVAYISARADLLMTTGVLLAVIAAERERWGWMLVACLFAVGAKESGIVAVPMALMWAIGRRQVPVWLFVSALVLGLVGASAMFRFYDLSGFDLTYTAQETAKLWHLLGKVVIPIGLSIDHDYGQWPAAWPMVTLIGTVALGCLALTSPRQWSFGVLFVLVALSPRLLIPLVEGLHEHHLYLPLLGIALALVGSFAKGSDGISETLPQA